MTLLQRLLPRFRRPLRRDTLEIPTLHPFHGPVYAVGDVHGCLSLYTELEAAILRDSQSFDHTPAIILLGDMVDRGIQSAQLIDHLMARLPVAARRICLMGNHEAMMLRYLADPRANVDWLHVGGYETLMSYGLNVDLSAILKMGARQLRVALSAHLPEQHIEFLRDLPPAIRVGAYLLAHAGADALVPLAAQPLQALLWGGAGRAAPEGLTLVHGHFITNHVDCGPNSIGIDTGAYATGKLTALRLANGHPPAAFTTRQSSEFQKIALYSSAG